MNQYQCSLILILSSVVVFSIGGCGSSEEPDIPSDNNIATESSTSTMQDNIDNQNRLEEEAKSSLDSATIEGNFEFSTQKTVSVDIQFTNIVYNEKIDIYAEIDLSSNTPIYLLEQAIINQSNRYQTVVSVASALSSLIIVRNDDFSALAEVTINNYGQITYTFEE